MTSFVCKKIYNDRLTKIPEIFDYNIRANNLNLFKQGDLLLKGEGEKGKITYARSSI